MKYEHLFPKVKKQQTLYCDECHGYLFLIYDCFDDFVEHIHIRLEGLPYLYCKSCDRKCLPDRSRLFLLYAYEQGKKRGSHGAGQRKKPMKRFPFGRVDFIYDSDDYYFLPGLARPWDDGFLTPVFFNKAVLIKYDNHPDYRLRLTSRTSGSFGDDKTDISFGINPNGKVFMWLGDIAKLPENEQHYLRSENIESDHSIGSEFYDSQIECNWLKRSAEDNLIKARSQMYDSLSHRFGERVSHLEETAIGLIQGLCPPIVFSQREMKDRFDVLNKIIVEAMDNKALGRIMTQQGIASKKSKSLGRLEAILDGKYPGQNVSRAMETFFVLYGLRVAFEHLHPTGAFEKKIASARDRLGVGESAGFEAIWTTLIARLTKSMQAIALLCEPDRQMK